MITKEQLTDAHEQGLSISTRNGNIKIVAILNDVYGVNHCDTNSKLVKWWMFENFERNEAKIEQPKPKYNGKAVKCDTVEQANWLYKKEYPSSKNIHHSRPCQLICIYLTHQGWDYEKEAIENNYEIISFSDYCKEQGIKEPKWIQGFEVRDGYNDVVMVSDDKNYWYPCILLSVNDLEEYPFETVVLKHRYCRYLNKNEINEIKTKLTK